MRQAGAVLGPDLPRRPDGGTRIEVGDQPRATHLAPVSAPSHPSEPYDAPTTVTAPSPEPVVMVDRIAWQWYLVTAAVPFLGAPIGFIAGIVFMARSKIGPALALWATAWLAAAIWAVIGWGILAAVAVDSVSTSADVSQVIAASATEPAEPAESTPAPSSESTDPATVASSPSSTPRKACGNLTVSAGSTTCAFAENVFYEY